LEERPGAHARQAVGRGAQGALERGQRPRGGAIGFPVGGAAELAQDARLFRRAVPGGRAAPVAGEQRRQPFSVEPGDQLGDSIAGAAAGGAGGRGKARAVGHRQERGRPRHPVGPFAGGARHLF